MPHTLVTGANSFVGVHIVKTLIDSGHTVTGSVRRASTGDDVLAEHPEWSGKLDFVVVTDYGADDAWDAIFQGRDFDYVIHVAAPMYGDERNTDYDRDWLKPAVDGDISLLKAAKAYAKSLKHIAVTGSINAVSTGDDLADRELTDDSWNRLTQDDARAANHPFYSYCSSKKESELAIWDFVENQKPQFGVTVFLPPLIFGPPIQPLKKPVSEGINFSTDQFHSLWDGSNATIPATMFPSYIDVRDLATAHVKALIASPSPSALINGDGDAAVDSKAPTRRRRYLIGGFAFTNTAMVRSIQKLVQEGSLPSEVLEGLAKEGDADNSTPVPKINAAEATRALGLTFRTLDETVRDTVLRVLELKKR